MAKKKQYRVLNPRAIPAGVPIIGFNTAGKSFSWNEGELFTPPAGFDADDRLLREGFYEEVK